MEFSELMEQVETLEPQERAEVQARLHALDPNRIPVKDVASIWRIVLITLAFIGVLALAGGIFLVSDGKSAEPLWPFVTLIIGGLVGLIAPSPVND